jgi:peptide/nickel transport system permease protein
VVRYIGKQLLNVVITLFLASAIVYSLCELTPGSVARKILGPYATEEQVEVLSDKLGLDRPAYIRYFEYVGRVVRLDFGESTLYHQPVAKIMGDRIANTAILAFFCALVIVPLSIVFGMLAGAKERGAIDRGILVFSSISASIPEFAMGVFLVGIFTIWLGVLPGTAPLSSDPVWPLWSQLVLPVAVVSLYVTGYLVAMVRESAIHVIHQNHVRTAVLKGMSMGAVVRRHVLRNAIIRPFPVILLQINYLISGLVVVETLFSYPGFGRLMLEAALNKDIAMVEAGTLFAVVVAVATQLAGDAAYLLLDPKARMLLARKGAA